MAKPTLGPCGLLWRWPALRPDAAISKTGKPWTSRLSLPAGRMTPGTAGDLDGLAKSHWGQTTPPCPIQSLIDARGPAGPPSPKTLTSETWAQTRKFMSSTPNKHGWQPAALRARYQGDPGRHPSRATLAGATRPRSGRGLSPVIQTIARLDRQPVNAGIHSPSLRDFFPGNPAYLFQNRLRAGLCPFGRTGRPKLARPGSLIPTPDPREKRPWFGHGCGRGQAWLSLAARKDGAFRSGPWEDLSPSSSAWPPAPN